MTFSFTRAVREQVGLIVGLAGGTGSGKTYSSLRLATGLSNGKPFALIDTENGRAKHYATEFAFDHGDLRAPFRPEAYAEAIKAADEARYPVIVVDSCSHEWTGEGGILDWQDEELDRMAGDDWKKREACKMAAWIKPKMDHKKMMARLLQVRAHLILCFRAEEKIDMVRGDDGRMKIIPKVTRTGLDGWVPICEKNMPYELTASFLLTADAPGLPKPIKLERQHRELFVLDQPIDEKAGRLLAEWAAGGVKPAPELDKLIADLAKCSTDAELKALEKRRAAVWTKPMPAGYKTRVKEASDAAIQRVAGGGSAPDASTWASTLTGQEKLSDLEEAWESCSQAFGGMPPNECDAAYQTRKESLSAA
jgi:hypothetical protein